MKHSSKRVISVTVSLALMASLFVGMSTVVFAGDTADYAVTYSAEEMTDIDDLIKLAIEQSNQKDLSFLKNGYNILELSAVQLLEKRVYGDGSKSEHYASTSIIPSKEKLLYLATHDPINTGFEHGGYDSYTVSDYTVSGTVYFSTKCGCQSGDLCIGNDYTYRVDRVVTNIIKEATTSISVKSARHMYILTSSTTKSQAINYANSSGVGGQSFTLHSSHSGFYESHDDVLTCMVSGVGAQSIVNFSNGSQIVLSMRVFRGMGQ